METVVIASPVKCSVGQIVPIDRYEHSKEGIPAMILKEITKEEYIRQSQQEDPEYFERNKDLYYEIREPYYYEVSTD